MSSKKNPVKSSFSQIKNALKTFYSRVTGDKLLGILLITRALTPLIIVILISFTGYKLVSELHGSVSSNLEQIGESMTKIDDSIKSINNNIKTLEQEFDTVNTSLNSTFEDSKTKLNNIKDLLEKLDFKVPINIPGFNMPGFNMPGFNMPGFNMPGFNILSFFKFTGYNFPGYNFPGYNFPGYNFPGYNFPGINRIIDLDSALKPLAKPIDSLSKSLENVVNVFKPISDSLSSINQEFSNLKDVINKDVTPSSDKLIKKVNKTVILYIEEIVVLLSFLLLLLINYFGLPLAKNFKDGISLIKKKSYNSD